MKSNQLFEEQVLKNCVIIKEDVDKLNAEEFTMLRRCGLGASDSSVILGLHGAWKTQDQIIAEKIITEGITEDEAAVSEIVNVRKGRDLEPLILKKASDKLDALVYKPTTMYGIKDTPLLINYDGVACIDNVNIIPVEAKFISQYGEKYYDRSKDMSREALANKIARNDQTNPHFTIEEKAAISGVPSYYYTQVQQQMMGLNAPYGILAALHDKDWTLRLYFIPKDHLVQSHIKIEGFKLWQRILRVKGRM